jgi:amino acid transporter
VARYVFALGRDGILPRAMGSTHPAHQSPHRGSLAQSFLALAVVAIFALAGADPILTLFSWLTNVGTLGVIALMALASFSVPAFFSRHPQHRRAWLVTTGLPVLAGVALAAVLALGVANFDLLTGASRSLAFSLTATLAVAAGLGAVLGTRAGRRRGRSTEACPAEQA